MSAWKGFARVGLGLALAAALLAVQGCTYLKNRGATACRMVEAGVTYTKTSQLELYACGVGVAAFGAGQLDGYLYGIGGGEIGKIRHYEKTLGLGFLGYEEMGWGQFDVEKQETLDCHYVALVGWITHPERRPGYAPA